MKDYPPFALRVQGEKHKKNNLICQDFADKYSDENMSIVAVADGHGSDQYFRSDLGSHFAVEVALHSIKQFIDVNPLCNADLVNKERKDKLEDLSRNIMQAWYEKVDEHEAANPLKSDPKLATIEEKYRTRYLNDGARKYIYHAYGTTLIAVAMTQDFWFGVHVGDGKCEVLFDDGTWDQPIPWDDRCFLNSTTSICDEASYRNGFRFWFGFQNEDKSFSDFRYGIDSQNKDQSKNIYSRPVAIFIGSDGVDDTYPVHENEKHLQNLYRNFVLSFAANGFDRTTGQIFEIAKKLADQGSQDDVSIAGIVGELTPAFVDFLTLQALADKENEKAIEERKKVVAKEQAVQGAQAKAEKMNNSVLNIRKEEQLAKKELDQKLSELERLKNNKIWIKNSIQKTEQDIRNATQKHKKLKADLLIAEGDLSAQQQIVRANENDKVTAEMQARKQEEISKSFYIKVNDYRIGIEKPIISPSVRDGLGQFGMGVTQTVFNVVDVASELTEDLMKLIDNSLGANKNQ